MYRRLGFFDKIFHEEPGGCLFKIAGARKSYMSGGE